MLRNIKIDKTRNVMVQDLPEENVRQDFITNIGEKLLNWPTAMLKTEYPIAHYKGGLGRSDLVLFVPCHKDQDKLYHEDPGVPFGIAEFKSPIIPLSYDHFEQAKAYANQAKVDLIILFNGKELEVYRRGASNEAWQQIEKIPTYAEAIQGKLKTIPQMETLTPLKRPDWRMLSDVEMRDKIFMDLARRQFVAPNLPTGLRAALIDLAGIIMDDTEVPPTTLPWHGYGVTVHRILGVRRKTYGHAVGSDMGWHCRGVVYSLDGWQQPRILHFTIYDGGEYKDHAFYDNRNAKTVLIVGQDVKRQFDLKLNFQKPLFLDQSGRSFNLTHDGTMTVGKAGLRPEVVINWVNKKAPQLFTRSGNLINLGTIHPGNRALVWEDLKDFFLRTILYTVCRNELKALIKSQKSQK